MRKSVLSIKLLFYARKVQYFLWETKVSLGRCLSLVSVCLGNTCSAKNAETAKYTFQFLNRLYKLQVAILLFFKTKMVRNFTRLTIRSKKIRKVVVRSDIYLTSGTCRQQVPHCCGHERLTRLRSYCAIHREEGYSKIRYQLSCADWRFEQQ